MNDTPFCRATALKFRNRIKYTKEKNRALSYKFFPFPLSLYHWFLFTNWYSTCLISDICPFSISLQYHNPITGNLDGEQAFRLYISVYKYIINDINDKHPIPIPTNHSIILCKNGYKIGKTGWFSLLGKVL